MTPSLANATPDHTTEPWRNNLRHELDAELADSRPAWWWTGRTPPDCPGRQSDGTLTSLSLPNLATCDRQQVLDYFDAVKIGLTATPAPHTATIFGQPVFWYKYNQAVSDRKLVPYDMNHRSKFSRRWRKMVLPGKKAKRSKRLIR